MLFVIVREAPSQQYTAPPSCPALFPVTVQLLILKEELVYAASIAPQKRAAVLRAIRQRVKLREQRSDPMPPLHLPEVLSSTSQSIIVRAESSQHITAPPLIPAEFSTILQRVRTSSDRLPQNIPPPFPFTPLIVPDVELPQMRQSVMVREESSQHDIPPPEPGTELSLIVQPTSVGEAPEVGFNPPPLSAVFRVIVQAITVGEAPTHKMPPPPIPLAAGRGSVSQVPLPPVSVNPSRTDAAVSLLSKTTTLARLESVGVPIRMTVSSAPASARTVMALPRNVMGSVTTYSPVATSTIAPSSAASIPAWIVLKSKSAPGPTVMVGSLAVVRLPRPAAVPREGKVQVALASCVQARKHRATPANRTMLR